MGWSLFLDPYKGRFQAAGVEPDFDFFGIVFFIERAESHPVNDAPGLLALADACR